MLPLARELLRIGAEVVLAANDEPSLNDVTHYELRDLVQRAAEIESAFGSRRLSIVKSGCVSPLIDLARVSNEVAKASVGAGLVMLVGMGRAVESNWMAAFSCPCLRVASIKNSHVAEGLDGKIYDAVVRFELPSG